MSIIVKAAAVFGIINNAPGTASPIPGLLAPFAFNPPLKVIAAIGLAILGGITAGVVGSTVFKKRFAHTETATIPEGAVLE